MTVALSAYRLMVYEELEKDIMMKLQESKNFKPDEKEKKSFFDKMKDIF